MPRVRQFALRVTVYDSGGFDRSSSPSSTWKCSSSHASTASRATNPSWWRLPLRKADPPHVRLALLDQWHPQIESCLLHRATVNRPKDNLSQASMHLPPLEDPSQAKLHLPANLGTCLLQVVNYMLNHHTALTRMSGPHLHLQDPMPRGPRVLSHRHINSRPSSSPARMVLHKESHEVFRFNSSNHPLLNM